MQNEQALFGISSELSNKIRIQILVHVQNEIILITKILSKFQNFKIMLILNELIKTKKIATHHNKPLVFEIYSGDLTLGFLNKT
ncbi:hypothetical protein BpHYR1_019183 [Brachionus plicatilis]|uniref:Uncharacterized protein n=1 Tax=Brachionus plicatilis TaxID=10195 RepID=A0A3M7QRY9_BRAPC|nr:hypothetical protein BpHYR1_019183 [Brachionus plicatilis]